MKVGLCVISRTCPETSTLVYEHVQISVWWQKKKKKKRVLLWNGNNELLPNVSSVSDASCRCFSSHRPPVSSTHFPVLFRDVTSHDEKTGTELTGSASCTVCTLYGGTVYSVCLIQTLIKHDIVACFYKLWRSNLGGESIWGGKTKQKKQKNNDVLTEHQTFLAWFCNDQTRTRELIRIVAHELIFIRVRTKRAAALKTVYAHVFLNKLDEFVSRAQSWCNKISNTVDDNKIAVMIIFTLVLVQQRTPGP